METLIVIPLQKELNLFLQAFAERGLQAEMARIGKLPVVQFPQLNLTVAQGGLGKVQFAIQTQHLLDAYRGWNLVLCAGAAGALVDNVSYGDVIVATETVEHDIYNNFGKPIIPRYRCDHSVIDAFKRTAASLDSFRVRFGPIASGDEDVTQIRRRTELHRRTRALAVAWEGAGGARACQFSEVPFLEVRGITDHADDGAPTDFEVNLSAAMSNIAILVHTWLQTPFG